MKFLALAAIAIVAAQDEATEEAAAPECTETQCPVTDETGTTTCTEQADVDASEGAIVCDAPAEDGTAEEAEGSQALFAGVAAVAVAATFMY